MSLRYNLFFMRIDCFKSGVSHGLRVFYFIRVWVRCRRPKLHFLDVLSCNHDSGLRPATNELYNDWARLRHNHCLPIFRLDPLLDDLSLAMRDLDLLQCEQRPQLKGFVAQIEQHVVCGARCVFWDSEHSDWSSTTVLLEVIVVRSKIVHLSPQSQNLVISLLNRWLQGTHSLLQVSDRGLQGTSNGVQRCQHGLLLQRSGGTKIQRSMVAWLIRCRGRTLPWHCNSSGTIIMTMFIHFPA